MPLPKPSTGGGKVPFIKFTEGQNRVRIVSEPEEKWTHFLPNDKKSVECIGNAAGCAYCKAGVKAGHDYFFLAIDRGDSGVKLVRFAPSLYRDYFDLSQNPDWEFDDCPNFDIIVTRNGEGLNTRYSLTPCQPKPLTEEESAAVKEKSLKEMVGEAVEKEESKPETPIEDIQF